MSSDDLLNEAAASAATVSPEKMAEVKEILAKMQAGLADMTDEEKEEFRQGFVHKLAEKVRGAAAAEAERGVADMGYGFFLTFSSFLIVLILFGKIYLHPTFFLNLILLETYSPGRNIIDFRHK